MQPKVSKKYTTRFPKLFLQIALFRELKKAITPKTYFVFCFHKKFSTSFKITEIYGEDFFFALYLRFQNILYKFIAKNLKYLPPPPAPCKFCHPLGNPSIHYHIFLPLSILKVVYKYKFNQNFSNMSFRQCILKQC